MSGGRQKVRWNGAVSSFLGRLYGVAQGSRAGPLLFIFVTMVNFALIKLALAYADETSNSTSTVNELNAETKALVSLSKELGLALNPTKTQCLIHGKVQDAHDPIVVDGVTITPSEKITLLGFTLDSKLEPKVYLKGAGRQCPLPQVCRRPSLCPSSPTCSEDVWRAVVLGKIRTYIHLSLKVRLSPRDPKTEGGNKLQVILNDVARILLRKKLTDRVRVEDLMKKSGFESVNSMVCSASAMLAWRASKATHPLHGLFKDMSPRGNTRSKSAGKLEVPCPNTKNLALWNMATTWNAIPDLRTAKSVGKAKQAIRKFVKSLPV